MNRQQLINKYNTPRATLIGFDNVGLAKFNNCVRHFRCSRTKGTVIKYMLKISGRKKFNDKFFGKEQTYALLNKRRKLQLYI